MRCLLCPNEIDETKSFQTDTLDARGNLLEDMVGRAKHQAALRDWLLITVQAHPPAGVTSLQTGHVCPSHPIETLVGVGLVVTPGAGAGAAVKGAKK